MDEARSAEVLLARAMVGEEELDALLEGLSVKKMGERLRSGSKSVDDALEGGLVDGRVVGIWGEGSEMCRRLLVNALLKYPGSTVAVVDTTGNFDILGVYTRILERLREDADLLTKTRAAVRAEHKDAVEDVAAKVLDHVNIMRVFDFVGMREAIGEIQDGLEGRKVVVREELEEKKEPASNPQPSTPKRPTPEPLTPEAPPKRTAVADSEDEDDEEEMLFDTAAASSKLAPAAQEPQPNVQLQTTTLDTNVEDSLQGGVPPSKVKFILIDNLAQVLTPLLKKDYVQANALASTFLQSLNHLTRTHSLYTILANPATHPRPSSPTRQPVSNPGQPAPPPQQNKQIPPPPPSIFASNTLIPSLSSLLLRHVDLSLLVSQLPKRKMDAKVYYRDGNNTGVKKPRGVELVTVVEVLSDRWGNRVGAWGTL